MKGQSFLKTSMNLYILEATSSSKTTTSAADTLKPVVSTPTATITLPTLSAPFPPTAAANDFSALMLSGIHQQLAAANYMQQMQRMAAIENLAKQYPNLWSGTTSQSNAVNNSLVVTGAWPDPNVFGSLMSATARSPVNLTGTKETTKK